MVSSWPAALVLGATVLVVTLPGIAAEPPESNVPSPSAPERLDRWGDPLPKGALLSLGTTRLRQRQGATGVAFSPDGQHLVSTGWGASIRFWDVATGKQVRRLKSPEGEGSFAVAFSPNGELLASVGEQGWVRLWDLRTGKVLFQTVGHREKNGLSDVRVFGVAFAPDGLTFATAGADPSVRIWDVATGIELLALQDEGGSNSHAVAFSPDGKLLASGSRDGTIRLWNLSAGSQPTVIQAAHKRDVTSLVFTPDGRHLVSSGLDFERMGERSVRAISQIHVWNPSSGAREGQFELDEVLVGDCSLAISADGATLFSSHHDRIVVWDVATRRSRRVLQSDASQYGGRTHGLAVSPDGKIVASIAWGHAVHLWNTETGEAILPFPDSHTNAVVSVQFSPDGSQIVTGGADSTARIWDARTGEHQQVIGKNGVGWIRYVDFLPDGKHVVLGGETHQSDVPGFRGEVKICSVVGGQVLHRFSTDSRVMCGDVSADGQRVVAATGFGKFFAIGTDESPEVKIHVWDLKAGTALHTWSANESRIDRLALHPEGDRVWSVDDDGAICQWDVQSGDELQRTTLNSDALRGAFRQSVFVPGAAFVISGGLRSDEQRARRGELGMRSTSTGDLKWSQSFAQHWPSRSAVSPNGRVVAVYLRAVGRSDGDSRVTLRSVVDGRELHAIDLADGSVQSMAFSPDGKKLVTGMDRGHSLVWDVSSTTSN